MTTYFNPQCKTCVQCPSDFSADFKRQKKIDPIGDLRNSYEKKVAAKKVAEYERIMKIPPEERTFAEKMLVAEVNAEKFAAYLDKLRPTVIYC